MNVEILEGEYFYMNILNPVTHSHKHIYYVYDNNRNNMIQTYFTGHIHKYVVEHIEFLPYDIQDVYYILLDNMCIPLSLLFSVSTEKKNTSLSFPVPRI